MRQWTTESREKNAGHLFKPVGGVNRANRRQDIATLQLPLIINLEREIKWFFGCM